MIITTGKNYLKSAAIVAAMLSSTSAYAQWAGTWKIDGNDAKLEQNSDFVSGVMYGKGRLQGLVSPDKKILRGVYTLSSNGQNYNVEFKLDTLAEFDGQVVRSEYGFPGSGALSLTWKGSRQSGASAIGNPLNRNPSQRGAFLRSLSKEQRSWIGKMRPKSAAAASRNSNGSGSNNVAAASTDTGVKGAWNITIDGTEYGPFANRRQAIAFGAPDRNGIVTGTSIGRDNVIFIGRAQNGSNRKLHGIWMEASRGQATGRWGLMEVRTSGESATSMQARFSIGYRKPSSAWRGRAPGQPGMGGQGPKIHSNQLRVPTVSQAQAQWRRLIQKGSPFPGIHGLWPTAEIDAAIQPWIRGEKTAAQFGGQQLVDPCKAKCMGKEPTTLSMFGANIDAQKNRERNLEFSGFVNVAASLVRKGERPIALTSKGSNRVFDRSRENKVKFNDSGVGDISFFVNPPRHTEIYCNRNTNYRLGRASFSIPAGVWSDPFADLTTSYSGSLTEWDLTVAGSLVLRPRRLAYSYNRDGFRPYGWSKNFKQHWSDFKKFNAQYPSDNHELSDQVPCFRTEAEFAESDGRRNLLLWLRTDIQVR